MKKRVRIWSMKILAILIGALILSIILDFSFRPIVDRYSTWKSQTIATTIIQESIQEILLKEKSGYSDFVTTKTNSQGEVMAIETNSYEVNLVKSSIIQNINQELKGLRDETLQIPLGTLIGLQIFSGKGPSLPFSIVPIGSVTANLEQGFTSAGINQTRHQLLLDIEVKMIAILAGYQIEVKVDTEFLMAETVVVGKVPDAYTDIADSESSLLSKINDYGSLQ